MIWADLIASTKLVMLGLNFEMWNHNGNGHEESSSARRRRERKAVILPEFAEMDFEKSVSVLLGFPRDWEREKSWHLGFSSELFQ